MPHSLKPCAALKTVQVLLTTDCGETKKKAASNYLDGLQRVVEDSLRALFWLAYGLLPKNSNVTWRLNPDRKRPSLTPFQKPDLNIITDIKGFPDTACKYQHSSRTHE
jgi:hypothetical protein